MKASTVERPACFEYDQDIALIHGAFLSAQKMINPENDGINAVLTGLNSVQMEQVGKIMCDTLHVAMKAVEQNVSQNSNRQKNKRIERIHGVIFFTLLKSYGISCNEADAYYGSVKDLLPQLDWALYMHLHETCKWAKQFLLHSTQLPSNVLSEVLTCILDEFRVESMSLYSLTSMLKVLAYQIFRKVGSFSEANISSCGSHFMFPFQQSRVPQNSESLDTVESLNSISRREVHSGSACNISHFVNILKVRQVDLSMVRFVVGGLVILGHNFVQANDYRSLSSDAADAVKVYFDFSKKVLESEPAKKWFYTSLNNFKFDSSCLSYEDMHSKHPVCLLHQHYGHLDHLQDVVAACTETTSTYPSCVIDICQEFDSISEYLPCLPSSQKQENPFDYEEYVKFMVGVVDKRLPGNLYAFKLLVSDPAMIVRPEVGQLIEKHSMCFTKESSAFLPMIESVMKSKNDSLVELLLAVYKQYFPTSLKQELLKKYIAKHGLSNALKLPYFHSDFLSFFNRNISVQQAEKLILPLCLQSPEETITAVVNKVIVHGRVSSVVQALKAVNYVCGYQESENELPLLVRVLQPYFESNPEEQKMEENILFLIQELLKEFDGDDTGFPVNKFVESCLLHNLHGERNSPKFGFLLKVLNVVLKHGLESANVRWAAELNAPAVIVLLCHVVSMAVHGCIGFLKSSAVSALNTFLLLQDKVHAPEKLILPENSKKWVMSELQNMHPTVQFYLSDLIGQPDISCLSLQNCLCWLAIGKEESKMSMLEKFLEASYPSSAYPALVLMLAQLIPQLTADELLSLSDVLGSIDLKFLQGTSGSSSSGEVVKVSDCEKKAVVVTSLYVNSLLLLRECQNLTFDWSYIIASFVKVVKNVFSSEFQTSMSCKIFLEVCRVAEKFAEVDVLRVALLEILAKFNNAEEQNLYSSLSYLMDCLTYRPAEDALSHKSVISQT